MNGCKYRINAKCTLFSNEWAESRCHIKNEMDCPYHDPVSITNADRIRAMTDEELAEMHVGVGCPPGTDLHELCFGENGEELLCTPSRCRECWFKWLRQEVES